MADDNIPGHRVQPGLYEYDAPDGMYLVDHEEARRPPNWYLHTPSDDDPSQANPHPFHVYPSFHDARDGVQEAEHRVGRRTAMSAQPGVIHRGIDLSDLPEDLSSRVHQAIDTGSADPHLHDDLLDHVGDGYDDFNGWWTSDPKNAERYAISDVPGWGENQLRATMTTDWDGSGEDLDYLPEEVGEDDVPLRHSPPRPHTVRVNRPGSSWVNISHDGVQEAEHEQSRTASVHTADAEEAKATGGMIALYPRTMDADQMAVPGGEPPEDLHCTLVYFGSDVSSMNPADLPNALAQLADLTPVIESRVFGHANFNGEAAVYIVNDSGEDAGTTSQDQFNQLTNVQEQAYSLAAQLVGVPPQHQPWIPHITASYYATADSLQFSGTIYFDKIGLAWQGQTQYFYLAGA